MKLELRRVESTGSTNADLLEAAANGEAGGVLLIANHQHAGRGRRDRQWVAPPDSAVLASLLLRPSLELSQLHVAVTMVALAAADACAAASGVRPAMKWPNDLIGIGAGGEVRKLAGVLAQRSHVEESDPAVVVGVGLNLRWPEAPPEEIRDRAITLEELAGAPVDTEVVIAHLVTALEAGSDLLSTAEGRTELVRRWRADLATLGMRVRVELIDSAIEGTATDVDPNGALCVTADDGQHHVVQVGDVVHLRPAGS
jgi:BirA family biotin operon repressor/biotin-[acetyl-CoA-carboxylase] ligase